MVKFSNLLSAGAALCVGAPLSAQDAQENDEARPVDVAAPVPATPAAPAPAATTAPATAPAPTTAQVPASGGIVFRQGTGNGSSAPLPNGIAPEFRPAPVQQTISCTEFTEASFRLTSKYKPTIRLAIDDGANGTLFSEALPDRRLDPTLLSAALSSYGRHNCANGRGFGPQQMVVVDFTKRSNEPRLYRLDLKSATGIDNPVLVAHGIGSDRNDDGYADNFSNINMSLMSSLGAVRGAEVYQGRTGRALRLDGLDPSNSLIRQRYIVVHSYRGDSRRYFNAGFQSQRGDTPGTSEGCFVIEPDKRDWLIDTLANGGFLYAGVSGERGEQILAGIKAPPVIRTVQPGQQIIFKPGTGSGSSTGGTQR